jgi:hypothetical protein
MAQAVIVQMPSRKPLEKALSLAEELIESYKAGNAFSDEQYSWCEGQAGELFECTDHESDGYCDCPLHTIGALFVEISQQDNITREFLLELQEMISQEIANQA